MTIKSRMEKIAFYRFPSQPNGFRCRVFGKRSFQRIVLKVSFYNRKKTTIKLDSNSFFRDDEFASKRKKHRPKDIVSRESVFCLLIFFDRHTHAVETTLFSNYQTRTRINDRRNKYTFSRMCAESACAQRVFCFFFPLNHPNDP